MTRVWITFAALVLNLAPLAAAQEPPPLPPPLQDLDAYVSRAVADWETPGLSVAVIRNGEVVFVEGYGVRRLDGEASEGEAVDTDPLFAIGSTTKAMVAAVVGALVDGTVPVIENAAVGGAGAAGAIWSSASDMAKWIRFLLAGGVAEDGERLLSEEAIGELLTPQTVIRRTNFYPTEMLTKPHWITYGLGWFQADYESRFLSPFEREQ